MLKSYYNESPERTTILALALAAAASGMAVFPLQGKEPTTGATPNGYKDASRDPSRITAMFNAAGKRATGYGIATGRASGLIVVDIDGPRRPGRSEAPGADKRLRGQDRATGGRRLSPVLRDS